ncbi:nucleotidyltransferase family protein [Dethiosulfatarculus sandiegensis]|uniref:Nucleotidyl transferase domain-containing protein n=1 Tax=Dethiosulfatarculus sandiegensis TaxID=1429043 RepID=A0A0D2J022_9BACT|nr:nucleotidyltransferase family protein [Dethiosulfatarculus sandiegensis]KIX11569.1 hypothetical protein X474_24480 [Dethiosulfatarculus sandiegensis]
MRAMVLAAGLGTRLLPLTRRRPKCLMPVVSKPLLGLWLEKLAACGVDCAVVNTHHLADRVQSYINRLDDPDLLVRVSHEPRILGTGGGLVKARPLLGEAPFFLVNADVLSSLDLLKLEQIAGVDNPLALLVVVDNPAFNTVALDKGGRVLGFKGDENIPPNARWKTYCGLARLRPELLDFLPAKGPSSLVDAFRTAISKGCEIRAYEPGCFWDDLGDVERYLAVNRLLCQSPPSELAFLSPSESPVLARGARIEPGAATSGFLIMGEDAVVESGAKVSDSILLPGARIRSGVTVTGAVLADGFVANSDLGGGAHA